MTGVNILFFGCPWCYIAFAQLFAPNELLRPFIRFIDVEEKEIKLQDRDDGYRAGRISLSRTKWGLRIFLQKSKKWPA